MMFLASIFTLVPLLSGPSSCNAFAMISPTTRFTTTTTTTTAVTSSGTNTVLFVSEQPTGAEEEESPSSSFNSVFDVSKITDAAKRAMEELPNYDANQVQKNLQQGELGKRGEIYFVAQAALVVCILADGIPLVGDPVRVLLAPVILLAGFAIGLLSIVDLGSDSLSPFPKPTQEGALKRTGIYGQMRHPMYASLLSLMLGLSLITDSADRLILTGLLWYLLEVKSDKEEVFLMEQFGSDYADYQTQVTEKFLPMELVKILPWTE